MPEEEADYYFIEGGLMVFTRTHHLKRGYCCKNNCRHCPWRKVDEAPTEPDTLEKKHN